MHPETIRKTKERIGELGSQSALARVVGVSQAAVSDIVHERHAHVSLRIENKLRAHLGLSPFLPRVEIDPCPDCGSVHTGRCHNKPVALRPVRPPRPVTRWADAPVRALAAAIRNRQEIQL